MKHVQATLAELRARRERLDQAIAALEDLDASGGTERTPRKRHAIARDRFPELRGRWQNGESAVAIGKDIGVSGPAIAYLAKKHGWLRRPTALKHNPRTGKKKSREVPVRKLARGVSGRDGKEE